MRLCLLITSLAAALALCACKKKPAASFDLSNPKAAAVTFARALQNGDVKRAKASAIASGRELELVEAMTASAHEMRKLFLTASAKFGPDAAQELHSRVGTSAVEALQAGQVVLEGEYATVLPKNASNSVPLKRIRGLWKVDIGALIKGQDLSQAIPTLRALASAAKIVSGEITAGKYATLDEVKEAMGANILAYFGEIPRAESSTAPSTAQAINPRQLSPNAKKPSGTDDPLR